jgi:membrane associated rhomboid family serine protease
MQNLRPQSFNILPLVVKNLLIINGLLFLASIVLTNYHFDLINLLGLHFFTSSLFAPYQMVTHMFMHGSFMHIFSNMFALWMFGSALENVWGPKRFFIFYFACGFGGAFLHLGVAAWQFNDLQQAVNSYQLNPGIPEFATFASRYDYLVDMGRVQSFINDWKINPNEPAFINQSQELANSFLKIFADVPIVGASGAVFGVLVAFGLLFPNMRLYVYFFLPVKAKYFVIFYALFELYAGFTGARDGVAHFAHIGGALIGFLMVRYWNKNRRADFF